MCSWKFVIKQCSESLQELLNLNCLIPTLYANNLLTDQEQQELTNEAAVPSKQNSIFVQKFLPFKGERSFKTFLQILGNEEQHSGHKELFSKLNCCCAKAHTTEGDSRGIDSKPQRLDDKRQPIRKDVRAQLKELMDRQKKLEEQLRQHEVQELKRHAELVNLIKNQFKQLHNSDAGTTEVDATKQNQMARKISSISFTSSSMGSSYSADGEESDTVSNIDPDHLSTIEDMRLSSLCLLDDEQLFPEDIAFHSRTKSLSTTSKLNRCKRPTRSHSSINSNNRQHDSLKPLNRQLERGHDSSLQQAYSIRLEDQKPLLIHTTNVMTNKSHDQEASCKESISAIQSLGSDAPMAKLSADSSVCDHEPDGASGQGYDTTNASITVSIQSASDDYIDESTQCATINDGKTSQVDYEIADSLSACSNYNDCRLRIPVPAISTAAHATKQVKMSNAHCIDKKESKQRLFFCQEKDGMVYFISWSDKVVRCKGISKLGTKHDTVITYNPGNNKFGRTQHICRRANITHPFSILNFKNQVVLVAGDHPKIRDGSVYLYQLVACSKYQKAFTYKWNEKAKVVQPFSSFLTSPTHAVCTAEDDCIIICQINNNLNCNNVSVYVYSEEDNTKGKFKVVSLHLPASLSYDNGDLTSGIIHEGNLYLSIKTGELFGVMQVNVKTLKGLEGSPDLLANTITLHAIIDEPSLSQYLLFDYDSKLYAHTMTSSCLDPGLLTISDCLGTQITSVVHHCSFVEDDVQLHSIIPVPKCGVLIIVYYNSRIQKYILKSVRTSTLRKENVV